MDKLRIVDIINYIKSIETKGAGYANIIIYSDLSGRINCGIDKNGRDIFYTGFNDKEELIKILHNKRGN